MTRPVSGDWPAGSSAAQAGKRQAECRNVQENAAHVNRSILSAAIAFVMRG